MFNEKDQLAIDTIRALSIDAIEEANSGHPGLPMGAAPMAYTLWTRHLNFNPQSKDYFNRDRFVLSVWTWLCAIIQLVTCFRQS